MQFRHEARQALARAKALLAQGDDAVLRHAALELRLTLEAIVYDRLYDYRRDVPPSVYETWQPRRVLKLLLEIDARAATPQTVKVTRTQASGGDDSRATVFFEQPIGQATLKENYDALGSYLHFPTLKQLSEKGGPDFEKLRRRCEALVLELDPVVTPAKTSFIMGSFSHCPCFRCGADMRKRLPEEAGQCPVICVACGADHVVVFEKGGEGQWTTNAFPAPCAHQDCDGLHRIFPDEIRQDFQWTCETCGRDSVFDFAICPVLPSGTAGQG
jgi:hypothetical protein